ncbi:MAG: DNA repair protein RecO [bacterium]|nr:DNA repair protein RecO [bacterium]
MNTTKTEAIVLRRVNYGDSDKIINAITADMGKVSFFAKGVRKQKSKLAGGLELLSICEVSLLEGRRDMYTLISARIKEHYSNIVKDLDRTKIAYRILQVLDKSTEDDVGPEYYNLTFKSLSYLNNQKIHPAVVEAWFLVNLLAQLGMELNTEFNSKGEKLPASEKYGFEYDDMCFNENQASEYTDKHVKLIRLYGQLSPAKIMKIDDIEELNIPVVVLLGNIQQLLHRK